MPKDYWFHCGECGYTAMRYRNVRTCPVCKNKLVREEAIDHTNPRLAVAYAIWAGNSCLDEDDLLGCIERWLAYDSPEHRNIIDRCYQAADVLLKACEQETTRQPTSPGTILRRELKVRGWTQKYLAWLMGRRTATISLIVTGKKRITPQTAIQLGLALGTSPELWWNLETNYRLQKAKEK